MPDIKFDKVVVSKVCCDKCPSCGGDNLDICTSAMNAEEALMDPDVRFDLKHQVYCQDCYCAAPRERSATQSADVWNRLSALAWGGE